MNERGFFTIIGLCLLLVAAISIKGVHEFEANYSGGITIFQAEHELQTLADSYLVEKLKELPPLSEGKIYKFPTVTAHSEKFKNVEILVWAQNGNLKKFIRTYSSGSNYTDKDAGELPEPVTIIISVASCDNPFIAGKIYRRSLAYILDSDKNTIHFMSDL